MSAERRPFRHVYGPVPSRRLGRSLGVDLVPFKVCSYDCVYCQLGRTTTKTTERREWVPLAEVLPELRARLASAGPVDDVALAGSGEPTLHSALGEVIRAVRTMTSAPIAVLTNGSLLFREDVRRDLFAADVVLPRGILCCGFAGDKGFHRPELNASALAGLAEQVRDCSEGYSTSRTCETGLAVHGGIPYRNILYLLEECSSQPRS